MPFKLLTPINIDRIHTNVNPKNMRHQQRCRNLGSARARASALDPVLVLYDPRNASHRIGFFDVHEFHTCSCSAHRGDGAYLQLDDHAP